MQCLEYSDIKSIFTSYIIITQQTKFCLDNISDMILCDSVYNTILFIKDFVRVEAFFMILNTDEMYVITDASQQLEISSEKLCAHMLLAVTIHLSSFLTIDNNHITTDSRNTLKGSYNYVSTRIILSYLFWLHEQCMSRKGNWYSSRCWYYLEYPVTIPVFP